MGCGGGKVKENVRFHSVTKFDPLTFEELRVKYKIVQRIGQSLNSIVYRAVNKTTKANRALKIRRHKNPKKKVPPEIEVLSEIDHPNIVKMFDFCIEEHKYSLILEQCIGYGLFDYMLRTNSISEYFASRIVKQILGALSYMHRVGFAHSGIRPENIYVDTTKINDLAVKLVHLSNCCPARESKLKRICSVYYDAPEVLSRAVYSASSDVWSCGVLLFFLLSGKIPFDGESEEEIRDKVLKMEIDMNTEEFTDVSKECKDLVTKMLNKDSNTRISAEECMRHEWILSRDNKYHTPSKLLKLMSHAKAFKAKLNLQEAALQFIIHEISTSERISDIKKLFNAFDKNGDGRITLDEIREVVDMVGMEMPELKDLLSKVDPNNDQIIEYEEFLRAFLDDNTLTNEKHLRNAFAHFDLDGNGEISEKELALMFSGSGIDVKQEMKKIDLNGDGVIDFEEFKLIMKSLCSNREILYNSLL